MGRKTISVSIDEGLLRRLDEEARQAQVSRSRIIERHIANHLRVLQERELQEYYQRYGERDRLLAEDALAAQAETLPEWEGGRDG